MLSTPQDLPSTGTLPAGLALCATLPVTLWVSQGAPQTTRPVHPSGVQSWAGGSCRSPDPQQPRVRAPMPRCWGPEHRAHTTPPHAPTTAHWRTTKVCPCLECPPPPPPPRTPQDQPTVRGAAGPGTNPWCDPTPPPPPLPAQGTWPRADWARPLAARAPTHTGMAVSPSRQRLDEVRGSSAVWTAVRPNNQRGVPSRASEVWAHWPWVTTFGASRDPTQPNQPPPPPLLILPWCLVGVVVSCHL